MDRRDFLVRLPAFGTLAVPGSLGLLAGCGGGSDVERFTAASATSQEFDRLDLPRDRWREVLTEGEFRILRDEGTEPPHSSPLNEEDRPGTFICAGCFLPLFPSDTKFMSGTGWPSFWRPIPGRLNTKTDVKLVVPRTEYHCARCGGHQGHVFDDGPEPTGQRWCNNGLALDFVPEGESLPELRQGAEPGEAT
jgi:peptide-methionine (R)-S-oxide reductase